MDLPLLHPRSWPPSDRTVVERNTVQSAEAGGAVDTPQANAATAQSHGGGTPRRQPRRHRPVEPLCEAGATKAHIEFQLGKRVRAAVETPRYERRPGDPVYRPLKIYTIDPSRRRREGQTAEINIPFERVQKGPVGYRFEVEKSGQWPLRDYGEVDLNEDRLLITNGRDPAPTDPVFHHQMVYAVAMSTYAVFRTALGREVAWGFRGERLRLVPHAFVDANARYVRDRKCLEFGWYRTEASDKVEMPPGALIFSCLSHDVIAHELTHALLDGLRVRFDRSTNADVGAFHEAFADLVALLQRFSYRQVVRNIIIKTRGDINNGGDWLRLVFEVALGKGDRALRVIDIEGKEKYDAAEDEHDLGTVLVSAVIEAFVTIYAQKSGPMIRMATGGRTSVAEGDVMSEDLVNQLIHIATRLASQLLSMCIRAIDYCPPIDITFGEYLRAIITADRDLVPDDVHSYREAMIHAFRKRRIFPEGVPALTEDALLWEAPSRRIRVPGLNFGELRFSGDPGAAASVEELVRQANLIGEMISQPENLEIFGLADPDDPEFRKGEVDPPVVESVRSSRRVGPDGQLAFDLVAEVSQRRRVQGGDGYPDFNFYGGATIILGAEGEVRYVITKNIKSKERLRRQRDFAAFAGADVYALTSCRNERQPADPAALRRRAQAVREVH